MFYKASFKASNMLAFSILVASNTLSFAAPQVVDSVSLAQQAQNKSERQAAENQVKANSQLFYQLQILQDEMMRMRGQTEEQAHQIRQLKQQRLDDYIAFDKRIADLSKAPPKTVTIAKANIQPATSTSTAATGNEQEDYKAAFSLVRAKKDEEAKTAFTHFIANYPKSALLPNCYFWLGRLQAKSNQLNEADASFGEMIKRFPDDKRVPEAKLHRAKVQFELGDKAMAKTELENLIARYSHSTDTSLQRTVRQAREFLKTSYP